MQEQSANGVFKVRVYNLLYANGKENAKEWIRTFIKTGIFTGLGTERFKIGPAKILIDGSSSGPSSATRKPYSHDPNLKGLLMWDQDEADAFIMEAHQAGFQVTAHAIGDMAIEMLVNAIEKAMKAYPRPNARHRIEHCALLDETLIKRIKDLGIVPIANPGFFNENGSAYSTYYGDRVNYMFPCRSFIEHGIIAAMGSDTPVINENPMIGLYGAITRQDKRTGEVTGKSQTIGLLQAIRMYTYNGAYASYEEDIKGSIEEGKLADLIVLSEDIQKCPVEKIKDIAVDLTMIDGDVLYTR
jgi:predicted amidohydrolase YtcJ